MKPYARFSIAGLMAITAVIALFVARYTESKRGFDEYSGIWKVAFGVDNTALTRARLGFGTTQIDTDGAEILITPERLFFVSSFETAGFEILDLDFGKELKLRLRELRSGGQRFAILKRMGSNMAFAFVDEKTNEIDDTAKGNQVVYTAHRMNPIAR